MELLESQVTPIEPGLILADDNARFGLKQTRIDSLAQDIVYQGGIQVPLEVEQLAEPIDGKQYRLTKGHYRLAAATQLNAEQNAGLQVPCIIRTPASGLDRLKLQLSENLERENLSPMDAAVAIKRLLEAGVSKMDVRNIFRRAGGRKGLKLQPASNSFINMMLSFLEFPKGTQEKIHDGRVPVSAAYELSKSPREKWDKILGDAEADRLSEIDREEKDEEKFLEREKKLAEATQKEKEALAAVEKQKAIVEAADKAAHEKGQKAVELFKATKEAKTKVDKTVEKGATVAADESAARKALQEEFAKAEKEAQEAEVAAAKVRKDLAKLEGKVKSAAEVAAERAKKLTAARKEADKKAKKDAKSTAPTAANIKKAQAADSQGHVALTAPEMRRVIDELTLPGFPKIQIVGKCIQSCFAGRITDKQVVTALGKVLGEKITEKNLTAISTQDPDLYKALTGK